MRERTRLQVQSGGLMGVGISLIVVAALIMFVVVSWEPTYSTEAWTVALVGWGGTFSAVLGAIGITVLFVAFASVDVPIKEDD